jgi:hypothetical protein
MNDEVLGRDTGKSGAGNPSAYMHAIGLIRRFIFTEYDSEGISPLDMSPYYDLSKRVLGDYVTLDWNMVEAIEHISYEIRDYSHDRSRRRPLNFIMLASPGSGKSFFVKCLANKLQDLNVTAVTCNVATFRSFSDVVPALETIRNLKVVDRMPILFLDEFDSLSDMSPYLPLLWDGEFSLGHSNLKLGKLIIIMAGSRPEIRKYIDKVKSSAGYQGESRIRAKKETKQKDKEGEKDKEKNFDKLSDCLSRINGGIITIPEVDEFVTPPNEQPELWTAEKVCFTVSMIQQRFGFSVKYIPLALLRFVAMNYFEYGARSIAHLVDLIKVNSTMQNISAIDHDMILTLPIFARDLFHKSSLIHHIRLRKDVKNAIEEWKVIFDCRIQVQIM